jgi:hypothetical protein
VRAVAQLLPQIDIVEGDAFNSSPTDPKLMGPDALQRFCAGEKLPATTMRTPLVELPLGATEDRICGTIDIEKALTEGVKAYEPGLLVGVWEGGREGGREGGWVAGRMGRGAAANCTGAAACPWHAAGWRVGAAAGSGRAPAGRHPKPPARAPGRPMRPLRPATPQARANRGILYVDEVNLLDDGLVDVVLDSAASGINTVEREGISIVHPAKFIMIGSGNPQVGPGASGGGAAASVIGGQAGPGPASSCCLRVSRSSRVLGHGGPPYSRPAGCRRR